MSVYNGAAHLRDSIESVLAQTLADFEFLIADDASTDGSIAIVESYGDPRITIVRSATNTGLFTNLNALVARARAPLVKTWCQDDVMLPACLARGVEFHARHRDIGCFYVRHDVLADGVVMALPPDATPEVLEPVVADRYALIHGCLSANVSSLFFDTAAFRAVGGFREQWIAADFDIMVRMQEDAPLGRISDTCVQIRRHDAQWSRQPTSLLRSLENELHIYGILRRRLTTRGAMTASAVDGVLTRKLALYGFHGALRSIVAGRIGLGWSLLKVLRSEVSLPRLAWTWATDVPRRLAVRTGHPRTAS
jgi:glycosyltransferase involved in cell wall biosynthesis